MRFPLPEPPEALLSALADALDLVDFAILLLNPDMRVRFANRQFAESMAISAELLATGPTLRQVLEHAAAEGIYDVPTRDVADYVASREAAIRGDAIEPSMIALADGRRISCHCTSCPDGGLILTYIDITDDLRREEADAVKRINAELRFNSETLEDHAAHLATLAEAAEDSAQRAEAARLLLETEVTERRQLEAKLRELATTDSLTGALNRAEVLAVGMREMEVAIQQDRPLSVLMVDVDHFKTVNDHFGHAGGDRALLHLVTLLAGTIRNTDVLGRLGGEEFVVLLPGTTADAAEAVAERLRVLVAETALNFRGQQISMTISLGVAERDPSDQSIEQLIGRADDALYEAKNNGRNQVMRSALPIAA